MLLTEINLPAEIDRLELARRVLEPRLKVQLPIASGRVWLGATICPFSNTSFRSPRVYSASRGCFEQASSVDMAFALRPHADTSDLTMWLAKSVPLRVLLKFCVAAIAEGFGF